MFNGNELLDVLNADADWVEAALRHVAERNVDVSVARALQGSALTVTLTAPGGREHRYDALIARTPTAKTAHSAHVADPDGQPKLLLAPFIGRTLARGFRELGVNYLDAAGNAHLERPGLLIDVEGRSRDPRYDASPRSGLRMFDAAGTKILFCLLTFPELVQEPYRTISEASTTSLGTTQMVLKEMAAEGFLELDRRVLHRTAELYDRWLDAFLVTLHPKLLIGAYEVAEPQRRLAHVLPDDVSWGGESAAAIIDPHLRPATLTLYANDRPTALLSAWKARKPDGTPNVTVRQRFWRAAPSALVPTTLIHADLIAAHEPRQAEAAARLRENDALLRRINAR